MKKLDGIIFSDLAKCCEPASRISMMREKGKWDAIPYETAQVKGNLLSALYDNTPEPVMLNPKLTGWHRIFLGIVATTDNYKINYVNVRLDNDVAVNTFNPYQNLRSGAVEDVYWKCADMTGRSVEISKFSRGIDQDCIIAWVRFVPMTDEEVTAELQRLRDPKYKRLYATNDMHCMGWMNNSRSHKDWQQLVQLYDQSDVEWLSVENLFTFNGIPRLPLDRHNFTNRAHVDCYDTIHNYYTDDMLESLVELGHKLGIKMCASHRMGAWCVEYTWDAMYFDNTFRLSHMDMRCMDRDGHYVDAMSYAYPEVQDYIISQFTRLAKLGFDAVEMMYHRGVPYVLFDPPFVEKFIQDYGEDPRFLPLDDERIIEARCAVMTGFVRRLRAALDSVCPNRKVALHARGQYSLYECRLNGEDFVTWAKEGLISSAISYPQFIREDLNGDVWQDDNPGHIDLEKYTKFVNEKESLPIYRRHDFRELAPMADSRGVLQGPADMKARIAEWMELEEKYGVKVYFEIMPRHLSPMEYKERALELYDLGAERISLWDTYQRAPYHVPWSLVRRMGDKEGLKDFDSGEGVYYSWHRLLRIADLDTSRYMPGWGA